MILIDDVLIHGRDKTEHDKWVRKVLKCLQESGVTLNNENCAIWKIRIKFLGHMVSQDGVRADS